MRVWVVHLDDAAPSSGFEGVFSTFDAAKRYVEGTVEGSETEWRQVGTRQSWEATVHNPGRFGYMRWYTVTEEEVRD